MYLHYFDTFVLVNECVNFFFKKKSLTDPKLLNCSGRINFPIRFNSLKLLNRIELNRIY